MPFVILASAAAEENEKRDDNEPDPLVVDNIAKTVIHTCVLRLIFKSFRSSLSYYEDFCLLVTKIDRK